MVVLERGVQLLLWQRNRVARFGNLGNVLSLGLRVSGLEFRAL